MSSLLDNITKYGSGNDTIYEAIRTPRNMVSD